MHDNTYASVHRNASNALAQILNDVHWPYPIWQHDFTPEAWMEAPDKHNPTYPTVTPDNYCNYTDVMRSQTPGSRSLHNTDGLYDDDPPPDQDGQASRQAQPSPPKGKGHC